MEQRHTNPGYSYMIEKALKSFRNQTGTERVSRQAIIKYVKENFDIGTNDKRISFAVSIGIKRGVDCGQIIRCSGRGASGSFKLAKKQKTGLMSSKVKKTKKTLVNINVSSSTHMLRDGKVTGSSLNSTKQLAIMNKTFSTYSASANAEQRYHSSKGSKESFTDKTPVPIGNPQPKQNINDNIHFLHEVSSCLNRLNDRQRAFAKMKMMHLLYNVEFKNLTDKSTDNSFSTVKVEPDDIEQEEPAAEVRTADETNVTNDSVALVDEPLLDQQQNSTVKLKKKKSYQDVEELKVYHAVNYLFSFC